MPLWELEMGNVNVMLIKLIIASPRGILILRNRVGGQCRSQTGRRDLDEQNGSHRNTGL